MATEDKEDSLEGFFEQARRAGLPTAKELEGARTQLTLADVLPRPGKVFHGLQVGECLCVGSACCVNAAVDAQGREWILKWLNPVGMTDKSTVMRFWTEIDVQRCLTRLQKQGLLPRKSIPAVQDAGEVYSVTYIWMERVHGETLSEVIRGQEQRGTFARTDWLRFVTDVMIQLCEILKVCHDEGIVHRDIKPSNIMVSTEEGRPRPVLIDFGAAYAPPSISSVVWRKGMIGTPGHIPPEMARLGPEEETPISPQVDIFCLCAMLCRCVYGRSIYGVADERGLMERAKAGMLDLPTQRFKDPSDLWRIVERGTRVDPTERYRSAEELLLDLRRLQDTLIMVREGREGRMSQAVSAALIFIAFALGYFLGR